MNLIERLTVQRALHVPSRSTLYAGVRVGLRDGSLARVLPGVFCLAGEEDRVEVRAAAICAADDSAVLTGRAALAVIDPGQGWQLPITFSTRRCWKNAPPWAVPSRARVPQDLVQQTPVPHVAREVALLQVATLSGSGVVDDALRRFEITPGRLEAAADGLARTTGNRRRRRIVRGSAQRPWSGPEREFHAVLEGAGLTGWRGNHRVRVGRRVYFLDVAFPEARVAIEVDGWAYHSEREAFEKDRRRHNELTLAGWLVLRVTPTMISEEPHVVLRWVRRALAERGIA